MRCLNLFSAITVAALFLGATLHPAAAEAESAVVPLRPTEILRSMPKEGEGWRMTTSTAQDVPDAWPRSKAQRDFVLEAQPRTNPAVVIAKMRVTVLDTGCHPGTLARFANPAEADGGRESIRIASMPAFRRKISAQQEKVEALYENRFLITATVEILKPDAGTAAPGLGVAAEWIEKMDLAILTSLSSRKVYVDVTKDRAMTVEFVDEINPKRSSRSTWTFAVEIPQS
ncbi:hypothetical protein DB346_12770 [Verrucomicrobia bacterium LW23]|nr:hypothetical protein DB346_12770 [Verrucomicrobia bacterium LW23]